MARNAKATVDYFPHQTEHGSTLYILESRWGNDGYAVWFKVLERLGSTDGHFLDCRKLGTWHYLQAYTRVPENILTEILDTLAELGKIDKSLWSHKVIYCQKFIDGVTDAYRRRINALPSRAKVFIACELAPDSLMPALAALNEQTDGINAERERERERESKDTTTAGRTQIELAFMEVFADKEHRIRQVFPQHDFEVVKEGCLIYYRDGPRPADIYQAIYKWFQREQVGQPAMRARGGKPKREVNEHDREKAFLGAD